MAGTEERHSDRQMGELARPFVGRERELAELVAALERAPSGHGAVFLITGEAGIGKSRLMELAAARAQKLGLRVLAGRCWDGGGAPAYWPWVQVVRAAGGDFDRLTAASQPPDAERRQPSAHLRDLDPDEARFRLFDAIGLFLGDVARAEPVLVMLDDLHAADEPSLLLMRFLATALAEHPVVVVGSYREGEPRVLERAELFGEFARVGRRIPLRGLSAEDIVAYTAMVSGAPASSEVAVRLRDATGGNPFFLGEVVRALIAEGRLDTADEAAMRRLPEEVRALIRRRLSGLTSEAVATLRLSAVLGRDLDLRVLAEASTLSVERLADVLAEAVRAGVLTEDAELRGAYVFSHDLVRETLYEDILPGQRMDLHRTAGTSLERAFHDDLGPHLAGIAYHFAQAAPLGEVEPAIEYSSRAADRAAAVLAYEDAAALYQQALRLLPAGDAERERRCELLLRLGDVEARVGDTEASRQAFEEVADLARRAGDATTLARAAFAHVSGAAPVRFGFGGLMVTSIFDTGTRGIQLLEEAERSLPPGDSSLRARILARLAAERYLFPQFESSRTIADEAVNMSLRVGDPGALVEALLGRHWATLTPDTTADRLANAQEMLLVATGAGDEEAAFIARHARVHCLLELCDVPGVDAELAAMAQLAAAIRQPFYLWHEASLHAMRAFLDGRLDEAERRVREAYEIGRVRESEYVEYLFEDAQMLAIRWARGDMQGVRERIGWHGDEYPDIPRWRNALVAAELGDEPASRAELERHARHEFASLPRDGLWILHLCALAQAAALVRDERRADMLYGLLAPFADRNAISVSTLPFGPVALRLGMLATVLERWDDAEQQFTTALERCEALGARAIRAMVLAEHARMLLARRSAGDDDRALTALAEAGAICDELGMPGIRDRVRALEPSGRPAAPAADGRPVFRREGEYWTIRFESETARLADRKGLGYLAQLITSNGREIHVLELLGAPAGESDEPVLDQRAKDEYRQRLRDLGEDLDEARSWNDPERASKIEEEIDALTDELGRALGLAGRDRPLSSGAERARISVTKAIRGAVRLIGAECPELGRHLEASIHTGRFCSYAPPGARPPRWEL
jgi:tetratricopeptide (TPR) repeat protein